MVTASELITLSATVVTAAATITLAALTRRYVVLTGRMVDAILTSKDPAVYVELGIRSGGPELILMLGNAGPTAAHNLSFTVTDSIAWAAGGHDGPDTIPALKEGIAYLAPGRTLNYGLGFFAWPEKGADTGRLTVSIEYRTAEGRPLQTRATMRIRDYQNLRADTFESPEQSIVRAIERTAAQDWSPQLARVSTKRCPMCAETIPRAARKCSRCGESLDPPTSPADNTSESA